MDNVPQLIEAVEQAREQFIATVSNLSFEQVSFKPEPDAWSITENTEHIVRAEQSGLMGIWKALDGIKRNKPVWSGEKIHDGLSIEAIVEKTWQPQEKVPEIAAPYWGGSIAYWIALLKAQTQLLHELGEALVGFDIESIVYPHPISGPLDVRQRLEFLRFHLNRHQVQVERLKQHVDYPFSITYAER